MDMAMASTMARAPTNGEPARRARLVRIVAVALAALSLAVWSFANALVNVNHFKRPDVALRVSPSDPVALASLGSSMLAQGGPTALVNPDVSELASSSLRNLALNSAALQLLGMSTAASGDVATARKQFTLASRISRRDLGTQLWMIEDAVAREDIPSALVHYDIALRTKNQAQELLFPVLTSALEDERIWPAFLPYIRERAPWLGAFFRHAIRNSQHPEAFAKLALRAGGLPPGEEFLGLQQELISRLIAERQFSTARNYYLTAKRASPRVFAAAELNSVTTDSRFPPITWHPAANEAVRASILTAEKGDGLVIAGSIESGASGLVARKMLMLPTGAYTLTARHSLRDDAEGAEVRWTVTCASAEKPEDLFSSTVPATRKPSIFIGSFSIPARCSAQFLNLWGSGGVATGGAEILVEKVAVRPIG